MSKLFQVGSLQNNVPEILIPVKFQLGSMGDRLNGRTKPLIMWYSLGSRKSELQSMKMKHKIAGPIKLGPARKD